MKLTRLDPLGDPRNTRERIVWLLAKRQVMTFRQLRSAARSRPCSISAQRVYKLSAGGHRRRPRGQAGSQRVTIRLDWVRSSGDCATTWSITDRV